MTAVGTVLRRALAAWDGGADELAAVEAELARATLEDAHVDVERLAAAVLHDLGELRVAHSSPSALTAVDAERLARRLGWLIRTLRNWDSATDPHGRRLEAALIAAALWDAGGDLWASLEPLLPDRDRMLGGLQAVLRSRAPEFRIPAHAPVWEREHFQGLQDADRAHDWARLLKFTRAFDTPVSDVGATQAARALWRLDPAKLVALADAADTWPRANLIISTLPLASAFGLATRSTSGHVRFAALERAGRRERRPLSDEEGEALEALFTTLAQDDAAWPVWMAAFNRYPVRFPYLQQSLGRALAHGSVEAVQAYAEAVELTTPSAEGGLCVANCLTEFRARTAPVLRCALWARAYERWEAWNFGAAEGRGLTAPGRSELDYAVVGWLLECAEPTAARTETDAFEAQLRALDAAWYDTVSSMHTAFNRLLSRYQVFAHACSSNADSLEWLPDGQTYTPEVASRAYVQARHLVLCVTKRRLESSRPFPL